MLKVIKNKINFKYVILSLYVLLVFILFKLGLITNDIEVLKRIVLSNPNTSATTFLILSILRVFICLPGTVFCVLGGLIFTPIKAVILSMIGYIMSLSIIFFSGKYLLASKLRSWIIRKNPYIESMLKDHGIKLFTVGLFCPIAPGDVLCLLLSTLNVSFLKYIVIIIFTHIPWVILYSFLGYSFNHSLISVIGVAISIIIITSYSISSWNKIKRSNSNTLNH